jgi:hypothetical protein
MMMHKNGGGGRIRTSVGFAGRFTVCSLWPLGNPSTTSVAYIANGAGDGIRTRDLLITNQLLYPLSYASVQNTKNKK